MDETDDREFILNHLRDLGLETGDPAPTGSVGSFRDRSTGETIHVIPRRGESAEHAMTRVRRRH